MNITKFLEDTLADSRPSDCCAFERVQSEDWQNRMAMTKCGRDVYHFPTEFSWGVMAAWDSHNHQRHRAYGQYCNGSKIVMTEEYKAGFAIGKQAFLACAQKYGWPVPEKEYNP